MGLYVRKTRTGSGAIAVQIAAKDRGVRTIVEHLGSAHTDQELAALVKIAKTKIQGTQLAFDLDALTPEPVTDNPTVISTTSRVLWEVLSQAYTHLGFDKIGNTVFKQLVLARLIQPVSKADTVRVLSELGLPAPALRTIWRTLARSVQEDWRNGFAQAAYQHATKTTGLTIVLYDVTSLYFESDNEDEFRKVGMSKERRVDPQIIVGLLVDPGGFPLDIHAYEGNKAETTTIVPVLDQFRSQHEVPDLVVVADAGMLSAANLAALEDAKYRFIVGSRTSSAPYDLAEHYQQHGNAFQDGQTIETTRQMGPDAHQRTRRVVWQYSFKRDKRDNMTLNKQIERAEKVANGTRPIRKDRFVSLEGKTASVNWEQVEKARTWSGLKGYVTNVPVDILDGAGVVAAYHHLFQVEASFRMAKSDLRARPMFHHQRESIHAHLTIVFCALGVGRYLQERTGYSIKRIVRALRPLRDVTIRVRGQNITATTPPTGEAADILAKLNPHTGH